MGLRIMLVWWEGNEGEQREVWEYFEREGGDIDVFLTHKRALMALWSWGSSVVKRPGLALPSELFPQCPSQLDLSWMPGHVPHVPCELDSSSPESAELSRELGKCAVGTILSPTVSVYGQWERNDSHHLWLLSSLFNSAFKIVSKVFLLSGLESFAMTDWAYSTC